jgi:hypothetical protein
VCGPNHGRIATAQNAAVRMIDRLVVRVRQHAIYNKRQSMGAHGDSRARFVVWALRRRASNLLRIDVSKAKYVSIKPVE